MFAKNNDCKLIKLLTRYETTFQFRAWIRDLRGCLCFYIELLCKVVMVVKIMEIYAGLSHRIEGLFSASLGKQISPDKLVLFGNIDSFELLQFYNR